MKSINKSSKIVFIDLIRNGLWFYFSHNNHEFAAHASSLTGRETIYVNDSKVSEKISWRFISGHDFELDGHHYRIEFKIKNFLNGGIACNLYVDHVLFESNEIDLATGNARLAWGSILILFIIGMGFGYLGAYIVKNLL